MFTGNWEQILYSKSTAQRILDLDTVERLEIWPSVIWIKGLKGGKHVVKFLSKFSFKKKFAEERKARSANVQITRISDHKFIASSGTKQYTVELFHRGLTCTCHDYRIQQALLNGPKCCKHGYAALNNLGFQTLADWIHRQQ